jgi:hypothetical protein
VENSTSSNSKRNTNNRKAGNWSKKSREKRIGHDSTI